MDNSNEWTKWGILKGCSLHLLPCSALFRKMNLNSIFPCSFFSLTMCAVLHFPFYYQFDQMILGSSQATFRFNTNKKNNFAHNFTCLRRITLGHPTNRPKVNSIPDRKNRAMSWQVYGIQIESMRHNETSWNANDENWSNWDGDIIITCSIYLFVRFIRVERQANLTH